MNKKAEGAEERCEMFRGTYCAGDGKSFSEEKEVNAERCTKCRMKQTGERKDGSTWI